MAIQHKLEDLHVGMRVPMESLSEIFDTYIVLSGLEDTVDKDGLPATLGTIRAISSEQNKAIEDARVKYHPSMLYINRQSESWEGD